MELGVIYNQFPLFSHFIDQVRDFPHVAPHPFVCALEGYYNLIGDQYFTLDARLHNQQLPHWRNMYAFSDWIQKWVYPVFEKPVMYFKPEYYGRVTAWVTEQYDNWRKVQLHNFGVLERNLAVCYLEKAADRLMALKTQNLMAQPERVPLKEISPYIKQSERAAVYLSNSSTMELSSVPNILNEIAKSALRTPEVNFSRLKDINKTVLYDEVVRAPSIKG